MKPAAFEYHRPASVAEALAIHAGADDARFIAGGQSLVPMMSLRLAAPSDLIDLNTIDGLAGVSGSDTELRVGAMTRQEDLLGHDLLSSQVPVIEAVVDSVGHPGTRTRGTIGGSLCHADPAAELPALLLALDAEVTVAELDGSTRRFPVEDLFAGHFETTIGPAEMLTQIHVPLVEQRRMGFDEVSLRSADFALAGAVVSAQMNDGVMTSIRVVVFSLGDRPQRLVAVETAALAANGDREGLTRAAQLTEQLVDPADETHLSSGYRRQLGVTVVRRALEQACMTGESERSL